MRSQRSIAYVHASCLGGFAFSDVIDPTAALLFVLEHPENSSKAEEHGMSACLALF